MKLEATVQSLIEDCGDLSVRICGWADADPVGTYPRPLGTINVPLSARNRRAYYIGRRIIVDVRPA